jgi:hypothetical protein
MYLSADVNATRFEANGKAIVTIFEQDGKAVNKQMLVDSSGRCTQYCPATGTFQNDIQPGKKATELTTDPVSWQWYDNLFIIHMDRKVLTYASDGTTPANLFEEITPFGKKIGNATTTYSSFSDATVDPSKFTVTGIDTCTLGSGCQQGKFSYMDM